MTRDDAIEAIESTNATVIGTDLYRLRGHIYFVGPTDIVVWDEDGEEDVTPLNAWDIFLFQKHLSKFLDFS